MCGVRSSFKSSLRKSCIGETSREKRYVGYVVPGQHGPPLCSTLAGVGANRLVHGFYTSFGLECDHFWFFLPASFIHHFVVMHRAQEHNSQPKRERFKDRNKDGKANSRCRVQSLGHLRVNLKLHMKEL